MTVRELIAQLEVVENKDLDVVVDGNGYGTLTCEEVGDWVIRYYGKVENGGYTRRSRECVVLYTEE